MSVEITATVLAEGAIYEHIPWEAVRENIDYLFSRLPGNLKDDANADFVRNFDHRWHGGHDLLLDVGKTLAKRGPLAAAHQAGHIVLTDFPTKAGIPIPGFSESGLGHFLANTLHVPKGYLSVNLLNTGIGVLAIRDGYPDLITAFAGHLQWGWGTLFDTFGKGTVELTVGYATETPLLYVAGLENYAAGLKSVYDYVVASYPPLDFLAESFGGGFITGGLIAFLLARREPLTMKLRKTLFGGSKTGLTSMMFAVNTLAGFAALGTFVTYQLAKAVGDRHRREVACQYHLDEPAFRHLLLEYCAEDDPAAVLAKAKEIDQVLVLKAEDTNLRASPTGELPAEMPSVLGHEQIYLHGETLVLPSEDSPVLPTEEGFGQCDEDL